MGRFAEVAESRLLSNTPASKAQIDQYQYCRRSKFSRVRLPYTPPECSSSAVSNSRAVGRDPRAQAKNVTSEIEVVDLLRPKMGLNTKTFVKTFLNPIRTSVSGFRQFVKISISKVAELPTGTLFIFKPSTPSR